jgi:hypothetical protein
LNGIVDKNAILGLEPNLKKRCCSNLKSIDNWKNRVIGLIDNKLEIVSIMNEFSVLGYKFDNEFE